MDISFERYPRIRVRLSNGQKFKLKSCQRPLRPFPIDDDFVMALNRTWTMHSSTVNNHLWNFSIDTLFKIYDILEENENICKYFFYCVRIDDIFNRKSDKPSSYILLNGQQQSHIKMHAQNICTLCPKWTRIREWKQYGDEICRVTLLCTDVAQLIIKYMDPRLKRPCGHSKCDALFSYLDLWEPSSFSYANFDKNRNFHFTK